MSRSTHQPARTRNILRALRDLLKEAGPFAILGLVCALALIVLFAKLSEEVFSQEINSLDDNFSLWVHSFASPALDAFFTALSAIAGPIGAPVIALLAFAALLWRRHAHDAWRLALIMAGALALNQVLKLFFHRTRPDLWTGLSFAGFSFPSGHATVSFCLFGMFAWLGRQYLRRYTARVTLTIAMCLLILLVGLSRIYLGAHFLSDVVAGYLSAGVWLIAVLSGTDILDRLRRQEPRALPGKT